FHISSRPSDEHFRGILFPVDDKKPRLIWLHCKWRVDNDDHSRYQYPETASLLGADYIRTPKLVQYNPVLKRQLSDTMRIYHRDTFLIDGSKSNNSIAAITATKPGLYHD
ncbi:hypothetical protein P152DRAFT_378512, partial [Eremomyces bilateralis CBS 781.70]